MALLTHGWMLFFVVHGHPAEGLTHSFGSCFVLLCELLEVWVELVHGWEVRSDILFLLLRVFIRLVVAAYVMFVRLITLEDHEAQLKL